MNLTELRSLKDNDEVIFKYPLPKLTVDKKYKVRVTRVGSLVVDDNSMGQFLYNNNLHLQFEKEKIMNNLLLGIDYIKKDGFYLVPNKLMTWTKITYTRFWYERIRFRKRIKFWHILPKYITIQVPNQDLVTVELSGKKIIMGHPDAIDRIMKGVQKIDISQGV